jgi:hypothetical protein
MGSLGAQIDFSYFGIQSRKNKNRKFGFIFEKILV